MVSPQDCVSRILCNDPESADSLYDLLVWVKAAKNELLKESELELLMVSVYSKTTDSENHRRERDKKILAIPSRKSDVQQDSKLAA